MLLPVACAFSTENAQSKSMWRMNCTHRFAVHYSSHSNDNKRCKLPSIAERQSLESISLVVADGSKQVRGCMKATKPYNNIYVIGLVTCNIFNLVKGGA